MSKSKVAVEQVVKLIVSAGQASPGPPVSQALGSRGVKLMDFCKVIRLISVTDAIEGHKVRLTYYF